MSKAEDRYRIDLAKAIKNAGPYIALMESSSYALLVDLLVQQEAVSTTMFMRDEISAEAHKANIHAARNLAGSIASMASSGREAIKQEKELQTRESDRPASGHAKGQSL
jgi:formylmethanofuran dehydrogenase subunit B|tara:strand:+ start:4217 stop:4543 length:327 start_codon:yes stop_codon:yes gene_type:complete